MKLDKVLHFIVGFLIAFLLGGFPIGLAAAVLAATAKEWWDAQGHGTSDINDWMATVAGGLIATILVFLM